MSTIGNNNFYTVQNGDSLWKIAGGDWNKINKICKANGIQDANYIQANQKLDLSCLNDEKWDNSIDENGEDFSSKIKSYDKELEQYNSPEEAHRAAQNMEYTVANEDKSNYSKNLLNSAANIYKELDKNSDGMLSEDELKEMDNKANIKTIDSNGDGKVTKYDLAAFLHSCDLDVETYLKDNNNAGNAVDGKFSHNDLQSRFRLEEGSNAHNIIREEQEAFFNHFYKDIENSEN